MELSLSTVATELFGQKPDYIYDPIGGIREARDAGFSCLDLDLFRAGEEGRPLREDDYPDWAKRMREELAACGMTVSQTHAYWFYLGDLSSGETQANLELLERSVRASAIIGDRPWVVTHPLSIVENDVYNDEKTRAFLLDLYRRLGETAAACGARIAVENLYHGGKRYFGCCPEDLVWLMEELNDPIYGICWDFGHANCERLPVTESLEQIAPYLAATHVHDNHGQDYHLIPYLGRIPWNEALSAMKKIGYRGTWNFEVHTWNIPGAARLRTHRALHAIGEEMIAQMT